MLLALLASCSWLLAPDPLDLPGPSAPPARPAARDAAVGFAFARHPEAGTYELPATNRPGGAPAPAEVPLMGAFSKAESSDGQQVWSTALPVRSNLVSVASHGTHFVGTYAPPGMEVVDAEGAPLRFRRFGRSKKTDPTWGFDRELLYVGLPDDAPRPAPGEFTLRFPKATAAEDALNYATSGLSAEAFAVRTLVVGDRSHTGLYLPAPASAAWTVDVPATGRLGFRATVLSPAIQADSDRSDGATVVVEVVAGGQTTEVARQALGVDAWVDVRADLAPFGGQTVEVRFRTEAGATPTYDYVLIEAPAIYVPTTSPRRFLLVFVDTLRPDHLGMYGYTTHPTSPNLDRWAEHAVRFDQARTIAPWTLPSARALLTGRQPEFFYDGPRLQERLADAGFRTDAFVTNAFLSHPFDVHLGWDQFDYHHLDDATQVVEQALDALARWPDRDSFTMVHFMEPHLPYREGFYHRRLFAGSRPAALEGLHRKFLGTVKPDDPDSAAIRDYVVARYDQNIRAVDDALVPLLEAAGPDATVALVSDHGEELWDHGGFEHGHSFYDELLRVPFVLRSPHLPAGTVAAPVSLLDLAPTLQELAGLPADGLQGRSLVAAAWGDDGAAQALADRPLAFGRPLYGADGWGVVNAGRKFWSRQGEEHLHVLETDPLERMNLAAPGADNGVYFGAMGASLGREVRPVWRVRLTPPEGSELEHTYTLVHPGGLLDAALPYDPRGRLAHAHPKLVEGQVQLGLPPGKEVPEAILIYPADLSAPLEGLQVSVDGAPIGTCPPPPPGASRCVLADAGHGVWVEPWHAPLPGGVEVSGYDAAVAGQLEQLGYVGD